MIQMKRADNFIFVILFRLIFLQYLLSFYKNIPKHLCYSTMIVLYYMLHVWSSYYERALIYN